MTGKHLAALAVTLWAGLAHAPCGAVEPRSFDTDFRSLEIDEGRLVGADAAGTRFSIALRGLKLVSSRIEAAGEDERPADMLPDGEVARGGKNIRKAWLGGPTRRYDHAVLGDGVEASRLHVVDRRGEHHVHELADQYVYEDRYPRLADLDGDGADEVLVIRSHVRRGAAVVLYGLRDGTLAELAAGEPIGTANRWLNIIGTGDFDGDGAGEIAVVVTPHIGGTLTLLRPADGRLVEVAGRRGFSNHEYGSRVLAMSAVLDVNGDGVPDIVVPNADRSALVLVTFADGVYSELGRLDHPAPVASAIRLFDIDGDGGIEVIYLLAGGTLSVVSPDR